MDSYVPTLEQVIASEYQRQESEEILGEASDADLANGSSSDD